MFPRWHFKQWVWALGHLCAQKRMGFPAVFSWTYEVKRLRNLGYSLLATALRTDAGAQPPGFTAHTEGEVKKLRVLSHLTQIFNM